MKKDLGSVQLSGEYLGSGAWETGAWAALQLFKRGSRREELISFDSPQELQAATRQNGITSEDSMV